MKSPHLPYPPDTHPWPTNEQTRANDAYRDSLLSAQERTEKQRQLLELCHELKADRTRAVDRGSKRT